LFAVTSVTCFNLCYWYKTPDIFDYPSDAFETNSAVLKVTLTKPRVNTNTSDVKLSVESSDIRRV